VNKDNTIKDLSEVYFTSFNEYDIVNFTSVLLKVFGNKISLTDSDYAVACTECALGLCNEKKLAKILFQGDEFPYDLMDIFAMMFCSYTTDEIRNGVCDDYKNELLSLDNIKQVVVDEMFNVAIIISGKYVYRYPVKLVRDYRSELLENPEYTESNYYEKHGRGRALDTLYLLHHRDYINHVMQYVSDTEYNVRHIDFKNFSKFVLKTKVIDRDKKNGWFTIECSVRSSETKETCQKNMRFIDDEVMPVAIRQIEQWKLPLGLFEVSRKWFVNGSVLYRFDIKKEIEECLK
jgi:hypothetical protein